MLNPTTLQAGYKKLGVLVEEDKNLSDLMTNYQTVRFSSLAIKHLKEKGFDDLNSDVDYPLDDLLNDHKSLEQYLKPMLNDNKLISSSFDLENFKGNPRLSCSFNSDYVSIQFSVNTLEDTIQVTGMYTFKESYVNRLREDALRTEQYKEKMANTKEDNRDEVSELEISTYVQDRLEEGVGNIKRAMEDNFLESDNPSQSDLDNNEITFCIILDRASIEESWDKVQQNGEGINVAEYQPGRILFTRAGKFMACLCNPVYISSVILSEEQQENEMSAMDSTLNALYDSNSAYESTSTVSDETPLAEVSKSPEVEVPEVQIERREEKKSNAIVESDKREDEESESMQIPQNQMIDTHVPQDNARYRRGSVNQTLEKLKRSQEMIDKMEGSLQSPPANDGNTPNSNLSRRSKKKKNKNKRRNGEQRYAQEQKIQGSQEQKAQNAAEGDNDSKQDSKESQAQASNVTPATLVEEKKPMVTNDSNSTATNSDFGEFDGNTELASESDTKRSVETAEDEDDLMPEIPPQMFDEHPDLQELKDRLYAQVEKMEARNKKALDVRKASLDRFGKSLKARSDELADKQKEFQNSIATQEAAINKKKADAETEAKTILDAAHKQAQDIKDKTAALIRDNKRDLEFQRQTLKEEQDLLAHDRQALDEARQLFESEKAVQQSAPEFVYTRASELEEEVKRLQSLDAKNKELSASHEQALSKIQELTTQLNDMVPKEMAAIDVDGYRRMESAVAKLKGKRIELEKSVSAYKEHIAAQKEAIDALSGELTTNEQEIQMLSEQCNTIKSTLSKKDAELSDLRATHDRVTTEFSQYRKEHDTSSDVSKEQQETIQSLSQALSEKQAEIDALGNELSTARSENQSLKNRVSSMEADSLSQQMESVNTEKQEVIYSASDVIAEMKILGIEMNVVPAAGRNLLQGSKNGIMVTFNYENYLAVIEKASKRPGAYLSQIAEWNTDGGATFMYYIKNRSVECKVDYRVRKDDNYLREHSLHEVIEDVLQQFQEIKK